MKALALPLMALCALLPPVSAMAAHPIMLEGYFDDWDDVAPLSLDPEGDAAAGGIDFLRLSATNDSFALFLRIEMSQELLHHYDNTMILWIDGDDDATTGLPVNGIGADLEWRFGSTLGLFHGDAGPDTLLWSRAGILVAPCYAASAIECAIDRFIMPDGATRLFVGPSAAFLVQDARPGGDVMPDAEGARHSFDDSQSLVPDPILLEREVSTDLRIVTYNVLWDNLWHEAPRFRKILGAIEPDVVAFQEIFSHDAEATAEWMEELFSGTWYAARLGADLVTVSRYPILATWQPGTAYASAHLLEIPSRSDSLLLLFNLHLPWGTNDEGRQHAIDALMGFLRDVMTPGNLPGIPPGTPVLITGDTNMLGDPRQLATMHLGDISDNDTYGPDFSPDWDGSSLEELISRQPNRRLAFTTYKEDSPVAPAHIDRFAYTGSVMEIANHFILHTPLLSEELRALYGLSPDDTRLASDHLPHVADIRRAPPVSAPDAPSRVRLGVFPNPARTGSRIRVDVPALPCRIELLDLAGRCVSILSVARGVSRVHVSAPSAPGMYTLRSRHASTNGTALIVLPD
ncbi:hypothetical protein JXA88_11205 [Candidatus Fermentibacteria bacterium]|nr:hypothetical protein [Candidatus Fermentibacteria bacterium]